MKSFTHSKQFCVRSAFASLVLVGCARTAGDSEPNDGSQKALQEARAVQDNGQAVIPDSVQLPAEHLRDRPYVTVALPDAASGTRTMEVGGMTPVRVDVRLLGARASSKKAAVDGYAVYTDMLEGAPNTTLVHRTSELGTEDFYYFQSQPAYERLSFEVKLGSYVRGLRLLANQLEFQTPDGLPGLRVSAPYAVSKTGGRIFADLSVEGCNYSDDPLPFRAPDLKEGTGSDVCVVHVSWAGKGASYPLLVDPEWTSPSQLPTGYRFWAPQIFKLASGRVFVSGDSTNASQQWDPSTGLWAATGSSGEVVNSGEGRAVMLNDGKVLAFSGVNSFGTQLGDVKWYDPSTGLWTGRANIPVGLHRPQGVTLSNGKVLVSGGILSGGSVTNVGRLYDPALNTWSAAGTMNRNRRDHSMVVLDANRVLVVGGGQSGTGCANGTTTPDIYTVSTGAWTTIPTSGLAHYNSDILRLSSGDVLVAGGECSVSTTRRYNVASNTWTVLGSTNSGVSNVSTQGMAELNGVVHYVGNESGYPYGFRYTVATGVWSNMTAPYTQPYPAQGSSVALNDGRILFVDKNGQTRVMSICGDGFRNTGEACDDGNAVSGDGCSSSCALEAGFSCNSTNILTNGSFEAPSAGYLATYGVGSNLGGWIVTAGDIDIGPQGVTVPHGAQVIDLNGGTTGAIAQTFTTVVGRRYLWQARIAGNNGCGQSTFQGSIAVASGTTSTTTFNTQTLNNAANWDLVTGAFVAGATSTTMTITSANPSCGGPNVDDVRVYDATALACTSNCGNGVVDSGETCDDGNLVSGDGCSSLCALEAGATCFQTSMLVNGDLEQPKAPTGSWNSYGGGASFGGWTVGGNSVELENRAQGFIQPTGEQDMDLSGGAAGSISQNVTTVVGRTYSWSLRLAANFGCGGTSKAGYVQATSGTTTTSYFSTTTNATASTWDLVTGSFVAGATTTNFMVASSDPSCGGPVVDAIRLMDPTEQACQTLCGNAVVNAGEACDDGNKVAGDGCSATCTIEAGHVCSAPANVVANGSFEAPAVGSGGLVGYSGTSVPNWTVAAGSDIEIWNNALNSVAAAGANFVDISGVTIGMMTQTAIPAITGRNYVWSVRGGSWPNAPGYRTAAFGVLGNAGYRVQIAGTSVSSGTSAYDTFQGRFTAGASTTFDIQALKDSSTGMHVDDVQIREVQSCSCDGNYNSGTPRACGATAPICSGGACSADAHLGCS